MRGPLTEEQKATIKATTTVFDSEAEAIEAALARLDFLERKVMAADRLRDEARYGSPSLALRLAVQDYDEVTE
jgi:hypothetical protein